MFLFVFKLIKMKLKHIILVLMAIPVLQFCHPSEQSENKVDKPNFVFIFADDLGYGDLSCFDAPKIKTPNLDKIAANGIKFTSFYSVSPVCSPSRAGLMTGRYPIRMGIHHVFFPESWTGLPVEEITMAEKLKEAGYATGIVGKWHLGHHRQFLPLQRGFDEYFGIPYSNDMEAVVYLRGNEVVDDKVDQSQMVKTFTREALDFIERHKDEPFFLYFPHNMPHVPVYASENFMGESEYGLYGDVVEEIDWSTGEIIKKLQELKIEDNTIIVFSSDNGPWLKMCEMGGLAGILREGKGTTFEGGMRVPTVMQWKARIKGGEVIDDLATMMDWFPTFMSILGEDMPVDRPIDGKDISPLIFGKGPREGEDFAYWSLGKLMAFRSGDWKIKLPRGEIKGRYTYPGEPAHDTLLFNLKDDPGERNNLIKEYPEKVDELILKITAYKEALGPLPPALKQKIPADHSFNVYLKGKYGLAQ